MPDLKTATFELYNSGVLSHLYEADADTPGGEYVPAEVARKLWRTLQLADQHFGYTGWLDGPDLAAAEMIRAVVAEVANGPHVVPRTAPQPSTAPA